MGQQLGAGLAAEGQADLALRLGQPVGAARVRFDQLRQAFSKGMPDTGHVAAVKAPYTQTDADPAPKRGQVRRTTLVAAVHSAAGSAAVRAATAGFHTPHGDMQMVQAYVRDLLHATTRNRKEFVHTSTKWEATPLLPDTRLIRNDPREVREKRPAQVAHHPGMKMGPTWNEGWL